MKDLLILDDDLQLRSSLKKQMEYYGYRVFSRGSVSEIPSQEFQFALIDMRLSGEFGISAIKIIKDRSPACRIVVLTAYGSIANTVECMRLGAADYLLKPVSISRILQSLNGDLTNTEESLPQEKTLEQVEHEYIDYILTRNMGNVSKAAKDLGLHRQSLQRKLRKNPNKSN